MKMSRRTMSRIFVIALIVVLVGGTPGMFFYSLVESVRGRVRLLSKTDHQALLAACQELSRQVTTGQLEPGEYRMRWGRRHPAVRAFPKVIRDLRLTSVRIRDNGWVLVDMTAGMGQVGVWACPEGCDRKPPGDRDLIPNLWYSDHRYSIDPQFDEIVDSMIEKNKFSKQSTKQTDGK